MASRSVIILPDDTVKPILDAIASSKHRLRIKMFVFTDPGLLQAVVAANKRGVKVEVMLNPARRSGEDDNEASRKLLIESGIQVKDSNPDFVLTHEKSMVVDDATALIKSLNWTTDNLTDTRDYAVITDHPHEVADIVRCFEADWHRKPFGLREDSNLIWCRDNGRERVAHFIDETKHTLFVQNDRFQDAVILERLVRARQRGVKIQVMTRPPHSLKEDKLIEGVGGLRIMDDVGVKVHTLKELRSHGKMLLADGSRAVIGSINLTPGSFDDRRELAIEIHDDDVVERLQKVAHRDWKHSHPLDLSDEGLLADLGKRGGAAMEKLVLDVGDEKVKRHRK